MSSRIQTRIQFEKPPRCFGVVLYAALLSGIVLNGCRPATEGPAMRDAGGGANPVADQSEDPGDARLQQALRKAISWLFDQQDSDGLWRSETYGNLKQGAGVTALVIYSLAHAHGHLDPDQRRKLQQAVDALVPLIKQQGFVSNPDGPDYSNYASAYLLTASREADLQLPEDVARQLVAYLVRSQLDEEEGFDESSPDYGGWDLSGWMTGPRPTTGTNISVTTAVLEALAAWPDEPGVSRSLALARRWLGGCQNLPEDGGFHFHPRVDHDGNKAGWTDQQRTAANSYGSATADGLRALRAVGETAESAEILAATVWLVRQPDFAHVPGFADTPDGQSWQTGLRYYYYMSLAQLGHCLGPGPARQFADQVSRLLVAEQHDDGSWSNPQARMREDDPLIATPFCVITLTRILDSKP